MAFEGENHTLGGTENGGEYATEPPLRDSEQSVLEESERIEESASETERESETAESTSLVEQESEKESAVVVDISFAERFIFAQKHSRIYLIGKLFVFIKVKNHCVVTKIHSDFVYIDFSKSEQSGFTLE